MKVTVEKRLYGLDRLTDAAARKRATSSIAMRVKTVMERYVPMREGALRLSAGMSSRFDRGEVIYATPYAEKQYRLHTRNRTTPGTDGEWDKTAVKRSGDDIARYAAQVVAKELS